MNPGLPQLYLARHGQTAWSETGQHTGLTDIPLTADGEQNARRLGQRLKGRSFAAVFTSPLQRARRTCELAGYGLVATVDKDLTEWHYGSYEGKTTDQIRQTRPGWTIFRDGCPDGETLAEVARRADRIVGRVRAIAGDVLVFSSGHFLRVLTARWVHLDPVCGQDWILSTAALSILGYEHDLSEPVIRLWNDCRHTER